MTKIEAQRIDRLDNHFSLYKDDMVEVRTILKDVQISLIGSNLNGNKGIVHLLDDIEKRVKTMEERQILADDFFGKLKWFQRGLIGIIFGYITWLLTK
jgi:hypothetical protein